jgi:hypothetical protein
MSTKKILIYFDEVYSRDRRNIVAFSSEGLTEIKRQFDSMNLDIEFNQDLIYQVYSRGIEAVVKQIFASKNPQVSGMSINTEKFIELVGLPNGIKEMQKRLDDVIAGIRSYHNHTFDPSLYKVEGDSVVLDEEAFKVWEEKNCRHWAVTSQEVKKLLATLVVKEALENHPDFDSLLRYWDRTTGTFLYKSLVKENGSLRVNHRYIQAS